MTDTLEDRRAALEAEFALRGFLSDASEADVAHLRAEHSEAFSLASDLNIVLQGACVRALHANHGATYDPEPLATRLALRAVQSFQATLLLTERAMIADAQTALRSLLEDTFCIAALQSDPPTFITMFKADAEAARRLQGQFIMAQNLLASRSAEDRAQLAAVVDAIGSKARLISPKTVAGMGPLVRQYLLYQTLSNDAAHPSAASLWRHVTSAPEGDGWSYRWGPGLASEVAYTLRHTIATAIGFGIGFTQFIKDAEGQQAVSQLVPRLQALPEAASTPSQAAREAPGP